jgi:hypothetical protein
MIPFHFNELQTRDGTKYISRGIEYLVGSPKKTGVMIRDHFINRFVGFDLSTCDELRDQLSVMNELKLATEQRIFIFQRMKTMGARRQDLLNTLAFHQLDIGFRRRLEKVFIADPSRRLPAASFIIAEDSKGDTAGLKDLHQCGGHLLIPSVKGSITSHPQEELGIGGFRQSLHA